MLRLMLPLVLLVGCETVEQQGQCLEWKTSVVEKKERLPYPLQGVVVREEIITTCKVREQQNETALVVRGPTIYI